MTSSRRGISIRMDTTWMGSRLRAPANVGKFESLGDGREQLLAGGNVILTLGFNLLGHRGSNRADELHVGFFLCAATCPLYEDFHRAHMRQSARGCRLTPACCC